MQRNHTPQPQPGPVPAGDLFKRIVEQAKRGQK